MSVARLARTVVHLKASQIAGRLLLRAPQPRPDLSPSPALRIQTGSWRDPAARKPSLRGPSSIQFLNEPGEIAGRDGWNDRRRSHLWLYNLHYFDDLAASNAGERRDWHRELVARWIADNPPGRGVGWEPYPTSLRIVNWIKGALGGLQLPTDGLDSLAVQTRWLSARLETHLLGNHLLANAKALVFAGAFFAGDEADKWLKRGLRIYAEELPEQILSDGGHFERSPMYHALILEDLLDLRNLAGAYGVRIQLPALAERSTLMRRWLATMTHPDGQISFFNDAALGIAPELAALEAYAGRLGLPSTSALQDPITHLAASGYVRLQMGPAVALIDVAPVGPDYLPGHAHADTLSCELSLGRTRLLVNGGTSVYGVDAQRQLERSTAAHTTVEIAGQSSSEVWGGFRVGRRARVHDIEFQSDGETLIVSAAHDGYRWMTGRPIHRRRWSLSTSDLIVKDTVEGSVKPAIARFHLGPEVSTSGAQEETSGTLQLPERSVRWSTTASATVEADEWRPEFGLRRPTLQLVAPLVECALQTQFTW